MDLVRLAFPRRSYTQSHVDYLAEVVCHVHEERASLRGYRIVAQSPALRHFTARLEPM
jgi:tryptophanase